MNQSAIHRIFNTLLRLYPQRFQAQFSEEMADVFSQALQETATSQAGKILRFTFCEYAGVIHGAMSAHWESLTGKNKGGMMKPRFSQYWNQQPANSWESFVASIPFFLFALAVMLPGLILKYFGQAWQPGLDQLYQFARGNPFTWWALTQISRPDYWSGPRVFGQFIEWSFALLIVIGLLIAWRRKWPQWSTTYLGFGLLNLILLIVIISPNGIMPGIGFLVFFGLVVIWSARRNLFHGFLTALPFATMFPWVLTMDGIIGWEIETFLFITAGLLMAMALFAGLRIGNPVLTFIFILLVCGIVTGANAYYSTYFSNMRFPPEPNPILVGQGFGIGLLFILIFTAPVWISALVRWFQIRKASVLK